MTVSSVTACGGGKGAGQPASTSEAGTKAPAAEAEVDTKDDVETDTETDAPEENMVSDENFAILQDNYALITELAEQVRELYTSDEIAANPDIEKVILQTEDLIAQIGAMEQADITEEDAADLNEAMGIIIDTYDNLLDGMEIVDDGGSAESGEMVSDETFAALGEAYDVLTDAYNAVATAYNNSEIEDADIKAAMDEAYSFLEQMGEITQDSITEEDAEALAEAMAAAAEMLEEIVEKL